MCLSGVSAAAAAAAAVFTATLTSGELSSHSLPLFFSRFDQISRASSVVTSGPLYLSYTNSISLAGFHCKQTSAAVVVSFFWTDSAAASSAALIYFCRFVRSHRYYYTFPSAFYCAVVV